MGLPRRSLVLTLCIILLASCIVPAIASTDACGDIVSSSDFVATVNGDDHHGHNGTIHLIGGVATGDHITFNMTERDGNISDYALETDSGKLNLIQYLSIDDLEVGHFGIKVDGSVMKFGNETVSVKVHDNPTGLIQIDNNGTNQRVTILLDKELAADMEMNDDGSTTVFIEEQGVLGVVSIANGLVVLDETNVGTYLNITLDPKDHLMIHFHPMVGGMNRSLEKAVLKGIDDGTVAYEISISNGDGIDYEEMTYDEAVDVNVVEAEAGSVVIDVNSTVDEGKVVFINIDNAILNDSTDIDVTLDGIELPVLSTPEDVIEAAHALSDEAAFYIVQSGNLSQLLVYIPTFSTHEISISPAPEGSAGQGGYSLIEWELAAFGAIGLLALASYSLIRRH